MEGRLRRAIQVRQLVGGLTGLALGLLVNVLSSYIYELRAILLPVVVVAFIALVALSIWLWWKTPVNIKVRLKPVQVLRSPEEKNRHARRGVIAFVSLYSPLRGSPANDLDLEARHKAARERNYQALDLPHSNLGSTIEAILTHAAKVEHCWLIATRTSRNPEAGSCLYVEPLVAYLQAEHHLRCKFHCGPEYDVLLDDDALVFNRTLEVMQRCFQEAANLHIPSGEMIGDLTAGMRTLTLGMVLSSLDLDRDIEMIGAHYSPDGRLDTTNPFPIVFGFEPVINET